MDSPSFGANTILCRLQQEDAINWARAAQSSTNPTTLAAVRRDKPPRCYNLALSPPSPLSPPTFYFTPNLTTDSFKEPSLAPRPCPPDCPVTCLLHVTCPGTPEA